jgi:hypothetical protein
MAVEVITARGSNGEIVNRFETVVMRGRDGPAGIQGPEGPQGPSGDGTSILPLANTWPQVQTMAGGMSLDGQRIISLATPTAASDATTKAYVDAIVSGTFPHAACTCATTADINLATGGLLTIDGVPTLAGTRVLVKNQTAPAQNGIYIADAGAWTRATDMDVAGDVSGTVPVTTGATYGNTIWGLTAAVINLGTDPIVFTQISTGGVYTADETTILLDGNMFTAGTIPLTNVPDAAAKLFNPDISGFGGPFATLEEAQRAELTATSVGMIGDNSTDNAPRLIQVLADFKARGGGTLKFNMDDAGGIYRLNSAIVNIPTNVELCGDKGVVLMIGHNDTTKPALDFGRIPNAVNFTAQTANFTVGATVTGATSGMTGVISSQIDRGTTGTLYMNAASGFTVGEIITGSSGGSATVVDFANPRTEYQALRRLIIKQGMARSGTTSLVQFRQASHFLVAEVTFDSVYNAMFWTDSDNGFIQRTRFWECTGTDFELRNVVDFWAQSVQHLGYHDPVLLNPANSPLELGTGLKVTNGVSGGKLMAYAAGRKWTGVYLGHWAEPPRPGHPEDPPVAKTPEHIDFYGLVIDNCKNAGIHIEDAFNCNFHASFIGTSGVIDARGPDPAHPPPEAPVIIDLPDYNGERRVGVLISAGKHPTVPDPTVSSTETVKFHSDCYIFLSQREGCVVEGRTFDGARYTPTDLHFDWQLGSNGNDNRIPGTGTTNGRGHMLFDGGDIDGMHLAVKCKAADLKITLGAPRTNQVVKIIGDLTNENWVIDGCYFDDVTFPNLEAHWVGDISANNGVIVGHNNRVLFGSCTPFLRFNASTSGITYTSRAGHKRFNNGSIHLNIEMTILSKGAAGPTTVATVTGDWKVPIGETLGSLLIISGGVGIPLNGLVARIDTSGVIHLEYQDVTGTLPLTNANFGNTTKFTISLTYATTTAATA